MGKALCSLIRAIFESNALRPKRSLLSRSESHLAANDAYAFVIEHVEGFAFQK